MEITGFGSLISQGRGEPLPRAKRPRADDKDLFAVTILVADDDDEMREMISEVLIEENGWHVLQARNGEEALRMALSEQPHALILDQRMPGLTGIEVIHALRSEGVSFPVVLITAVREVRELAESHGIEHFLMKPFGYDQLTALVTKALTSSQ